MDTYDYRSLGNDFDTASCKLDTFNAKQLRQAIQAIESIEADTARDNRVYWGQWFNNALVPVLKDFAEMTGSLLRLDMDLEMGILTAEIINPQSLDITESCMIRTAIFTASNITIDTNENGVVLVLIFDSNKYI